MNLKAGGAWERSTAHLYAVYELFKDTCTVLDAQCSIGQKASPLFPVPLGPEIAELDCRTQMRPEIWGRKINTARNLHLVHEVLFKNA